MMFNMNRYHDMYEINNNLMKITKIIKFRRRKLFNKELMKWGNFPFKRVLLPLSITRPRTLAEFVSHATTIFSTSRNVMLTSKSTKATHFQLSVSDLIKPTTIFLDGFIIRLVLTLYSY